MEMIVSAAKSLLEVVSRPESTVDYIRQATQEFLNDIYQASASDVADGMRVLTAGFDLEDGARAGHLGLVCGSLVENGFDPHPIAEPLTNRLRVLLQQAVILADACLREMPQEVDNETDATKVFSETKDRLAVTMPSESAAWVALETMWRPGIAVYSVGASLRKAAGDLRQSSARLVADHEAGHWLTLMLSVLDDEPLLAIEPESRTGVSYRMSGVAGNFQLNVLLMHTFPRRRFFSRRRVSVSAADVARGTGPQQTSETVHGAWNLYTWEWIKTTGQLRQSDNLASHWIWNEGIPADIPVFEGYRVVLLGPASYQRMWESQRSFKNLKADLKVERELTTDEVETWLKRMRDHASSH